jgi:integrase
MEWNQVVFAVSLNPKVSSTGAQRQTSFVLSSEMSIAEFVAAKFVPEHVALKMAAGRRHYQAILKHILTPEQVDRIFGVETDGSKAKLKKYPSWPYIGEIRLRDALSDDVQSLVQAALQNGYSSQTAKHIRNVVSAIFSHAIRERYFFGENPARSVELPGMTRKESHSLTLFETIKVLRVMQYPEREMALIAILTCMNMSEICGLQWRNVNLTLGSVKREGETIPPKTIAVRKQWHRGELCDVRKGRRKTIEIPQLLFSVLLNLSRRSVFNRWSDFVLASKAGTPINQINVAARRLKIIGRELHLPWLSWQVFRRTHTSLAYGFSVEAQHEMAKALAGGFPQGPTGMNSPSQK